MPAKNLSDEAVSVLREGAGGDEDALRCLSAHQASCEGLDLRTTDAAFPAFRLDIDLIEPEAVLLDLTVDAAVPALTDDLRRARSRGAP
jgi:hypothetical protein